MHALTRLKLFMSRLHPAGLYFIRTILIIPAGEIMIKTGYSRFQRPGTVFLFSKLMNILLKRTLYYSFLPDNHIVWQRKIFALPPGILYITDRF